MKKEWILSAIDFVDEWIDFRQQHDFPETGCCISIMQHGRTVFSKGYGYLHMDQPLALTAQHQGRYASQSKTVTTVAFAQLVEKSLADLDAPLSRYVPELLAHPDERMHSVTARAVLSHRACFERDEKDTSYLDFESIYPDRADLLEYILRTRLVDGRVGAFKYSNIGYALVGIVIENITGQSYKSYVRDHISRHLGRKTAALYGDFSCVSDHPPVYGHIFHPVEMIMPISPIFNMSALSPAMGLSGTSEAVCRFYSALLPGNRQLLSEAMKREMFSVQSQLERVPDYCMGLMRYRGEDRLSDLFGHDGAIEGNHSSTRIDPQSGFAVAVHTNGAGAGIVDKLQKGIWATLQFFELHPAPPVQALKDFSGVFFNSHWIAYAIPRGNRVYLAGLADDSPFSCSTFFKPTGFDDKGRVETVVVGESDPYFLPEETATVQWDGSYVSGFHCGCMRFKRWEDYMAWTRSWSLRGRSNYMSINGDRGQVLKRRPERRERLFI